MDMNIFSIYYCIRVETMNISLFKRSCYDISM